MEPGMFVSPSQYNTFYGIVSLKECLYRQTMYFACMMLLCAATASAAEPPLNESIILNSGFERWTSYGAEAYPNQWSPQQHAGELSFSFSQDEEDFVSGASSLRIERTGTQPWGSVTQVIPPVKLKGKRVRFSAKVKMEETTPDGLSLMLVVKGVGVGGSPIYTRKFDGISSWQDVSIEGEIPTSASRITVGITLEYGRVLWLDDAHIEVLP
jgi:hypothetical protein